VCVCGMLQAEFANMPLTMTQSTNLTWANNNQSRIKDKQLNSLRG